MAIFQVSALLDGIRGSIGAATFSYSFSGPTVRRRQKPTFPATNRQGSRNSALGVHAQNWRDQTTPTQRVNWATLTAGTFFTNQFGNPYTIQPNALFIRSNSALAIASETEITTPPGSATEVAPDWTLDSVAAGVIRVATWANFNPTIPGWALFFVSRPVSRAQNYLPTSYQFAAALTITGFLPLPKIIIDLGAGASGTFRFVRGIVVRTTQGPAEPPNFRRGQVSFEHFGSVLVA